MEPVTQEPISGEVPPVPLPEKDIAEQFKALAAEIRARQGEDASAAEARQGELKDMYTRGRRTGILWGLLIAVIFGGSLFYNTWRQGEDNKELTGAVSDLSEASARRTPTLNYIVCHDEKQDMYMITLGVLLLAQLDGTDDTVQRSWFEKSIEDLAHATDPESPDACPVAPTEGEKK